MSACKRPTRNTGSDQDIWWLFPQEKKKLIKFRTLPFTSATVSNQEENKSKLP